MTDRSEGEAAPGRLSPRAWLWTAAACVAWLAASFVPVPGLDHDALREMAAGAGTLLGLFNVAPPLVTVVSQGVGSVVLVRGVMRLFAGPESSPAREARIARVGFGIYVVLCFVQGLLTVMWAESASVGGWGPDIVPVPGWATRGVVAVTLAAGGALVWVLASLVSRRGVGQGPLVLFCLSSAIAGITGLGMLGADLAQSGWEPGVVLGRLGMIAAPAIVLVAAWRFAPERWPVPITRGVVVTSPIDLLAIPSLVGAVVLAPAGAAITSQLSPGAANPLGAHGDLAHAVLTTAAAVVVALWLRKRAARRGSVAWLVVAAVVTLGALALGGTSLLASGVASRALAPGPFEGNRTVVLGLGAEGGDGAADAAVLVRRFAEVGLEAEIRRAGPAHIELELHDVGDVRGALDAVLPPRNVTLRLVAVDQGPLRAQGPPPAPALEAVADVDGDLWSGPTREALEPLRALLSEEQRARAFAECGDDRCRLRLLEPGPAVVGPRDIADARVQLDPMEGRPNVSLELTRAAGQRFGEVTGASIGRLLAILVDDRILSSPKIMSAIEGGRAQITLGRAESAEQLLGEANALAAALRAGPLGSRWVVESER